MLVNILHRTRTFAGFNDSPLRLIFETYSALLDQNFRYGFRRGIYWMKIVSNGFWAFGDFDKLRFGFDGGI